MVKKCSRCRKKREISQDKYPFCDVCYPIEYGVALKITLETKQKMGIAGEGDQNLIGILDDFIKDANDPRGDS